MIIVYQQTPLVLVFFETYAVREINLAQRQVPHNLPRVRRLRVAEENDVIRYFWHYGSYESRCAEVMPL
jgi:hypothetical protein